MPRTLAIDCFPESVDRYVEDHAVVVVDVIRATTTAMTAVARGRRCYPVPSIEAALPLAARLDQPLLVGELGGNMPYGFDVTNSPAEMSARTDSWRSMILVSSSGTQLMARATAAEYAYIASLRNISATIRHLAKRHDKVALVGAGTRGEFREEDQACCAWIGEGLMEHGFVPRDTETFEVIQRWSGKPSNAWTDSRSVEYLRKTGQLRDLDFVQHHFDDLDMVFALNGDEVVPLLPSDSDSAWAADKTRTTDSIQG